MKIGIVGAGKVGTTLGKYLSEHQIALNGFYSKTMESAVIAAKFTQTKAYDNIDDLIKASDTLFITTPDGKIADVWDYIAQKEIRNKIICHFSGSLSSHVFSGIEQTEAYGCSIHPMYAFSDKFTSYQKFNTAILTIEGHLAAIDVIKPLFEKLGHSVMLLHAEDKMKYHAAAALASNYMIALYEVSLQLLEECHLKKEDALALLNPLVEGNVKAMLAKGTTEALTGPVERNDMETVQKHLQVLQGKNVEKIYRSLGVELVEIAKKKNPDRDYSTLQKLLEK